MIVSLLTDFGSVDHYVGVMKGVLLAAAPGVSIVDLVHELPPGDIGAAAYTLLAGYPIFPPGTVHVAVVDPGVGTARRVLVVTAAGQRFVGPDNGLFSYLLDREPEARVHHVTEEQYFRRPLSSTFHGRDVFAPLGAALARGTDPSALGPLVRDAQRLPPLTPQRSGAGDLVGRILHVDRFGNCITSISQVDAAAFAPDLEVAAGRTVIRSLREHYAGAPGGMVFAIWGSSGFLELSMNGSSAASTLGLAAGDPITVRPLPGAGGGGATNMGEAAHE